MAALRLLLLLAALPCTHSYMSPMCCGDNFCCSVTTSAGVSCWGGHSFTYAAPASLASPGTLSGVKYVACAGKTLLAVDSAHKILAIMGKNGYGVDSFPAASIGKEVLDVSVSFWGGTFIDAGSGELVAWSQGATYASKASSQSWYPAADTSGSSCKCTTATRDMSLTAPAGKFSKVACGGKRAGHFCCGVAVSGDSVQCFGDALGTYTPTRSELSTQGLLGYVPYSISAGCDFLCVLTQEGNLGVYTHSSGQLRNYESSWPTALSLDAAGVESSKAVYRQAACGTFAVYTIDSSGNLKAWGRVFSRAVGPVSTGVDTTGTAQSFSKYVQRRQLSLGLLSANSGFGHACGASSAGEASCWGADYSGQASTAVSSLDLRNVYPPLFSPGATTAAAGAATTLGAGTTTAAALPATSTEASAATSAGQTSVAATTTTAGPVVASAGRSSLAAGLAAVAVVIGNS